MGEIADSIIDGDFCQECGIWMGSGAGYPRSCKGCDPVNGEACEDPGKHDFPRAKGLRRENRAGAEDQFTAAQKLAELNGLHLKQCSTAQYQLTHHTKNWLLNIYPGNCRLYHDKNRPGDYLDVKPGWNLMDVVVAAAKRERKLQNG